MPHTLLGQVGFFAMVCVCASAVLMGGKLERRAALWIGWSWLMTILLQQATGRLDPVIAFLAVDGVTLLALLSLIWRSKTLWPLLMVALQGVEVAIHILRLFFPRISPFPYLTAVNTVGYGLLALLMWGTWRAANSSAPARTAEKG